MRRVIVIGSGLSGIEAAVTIARTVTDTQVTMIGPDRDVSILPNLVYVAFGLHPTRLGVPVTDVLAHDNVEFVRGLVRDIDIDGHELTLAGGELHGWDELIVSPGIELETEEGLRMRTLEDAMLIRARLAELDPAAEATITIRVMPDSSWSPPAYEFAFLLRAWLTAEGAARSCKVVLVTEESTPLQQFGQSVSDIVAQRLAAQDIEVVTNVQPARFDELLSEVTIDFGGFTARRIHGMPPVGSDGFYETDANGRVAPHVHVIGDASAVPYKAAFASVWEAQQVARALGGDITALGDAIDGVPIGTSEYDMDLGDATLRVRINARSHFVGAAVDSRADVTIEAGTPRKLRGTILRTLLDDALTDDDHAQERQWRLPNGPSKLKTTTG